MWARNVAQGILAHAVVARPWGHLVAAIVLVSVLVQWLVGLNPYSGWKTPPMFGDFEAQRHWMEVTVALPPKVWYSFDLEYWGLDYPPLTAFHSLLLGRIARYFDPSWVQLDESRGNEAIGLRHFMRLTAIASQLAVYTLFAVLLVKRLFPGSGRARIVEMAAALVTIVLEPGLLLVDHGHFQYNSVMLGFTLAFVYYAHRQAWLAAAAAFTLALAFKQMALFYALPVFAFLAGKCAAQSSTARRAGLFIALGVTVVATVTLCLTPFVAGGSWTDAHLQLAQILRRLFPFARGLYEDKVANVWCAVSAVLKLRAWFTVPQLVQLSTQCTLLAALPASWFCFSASWKLGTTPRSIAAASSETVALLLGLANGALAFFLFGFQVHEKSILLPLLPTTVLLALASSPSYTLALGGVHKQANFRLVLLIFTNAALVSMWPLLRKDQLQLPFTVVVLFWNLSQLDAASWRAADLRFRLVSLLAHLCLVALPALDVLVLPSRIAPRLPDLWTLLNACVCCLVFILVWVYMLWMQAQLSARVQWQSHSKAGKGE